MAPCKVTRIRKGTYRVQCVLPKRHRSIASDGTGHENATLEDEIRIASEQWKDAKERAATMKDTNTEEHITAIWEGVRAAWNRLRIAIENSALHESEKESELNLLENEFARIVDAFKILDSKKHSLASLPANTGRSLAIAMSANHRVSSSPQNHPINTQELTNTVDRLKEEAKRRLTDAKTIEDIQQIFIESKERYKTIIPLIQQLHHNIDATSMNDEEKARQKEKINEYLMKVTDELRQLAYHIHRTRIENASLLYIHAEREYYRILNIVNRLSSVLHEKKARAEWNLAKELARTKMISMKQARLEILTKNMDTNRNKIKDTNVELVQDVQDAKQALLAGSEQLQLVERKSTDAKRVLNAETAAYDKVRAAYGAKKGGYSKRAKRTTLKQTTRKQRLRR